MRVGMRFPHFRPSTNETMGSWFRELAQTAEGSGLYSLWVMDHFFQLGRWMGEPESRMMEGYSVLNYLAGVTERVKLGLLVGGVFYRAPAVTLKTVTSLDVLSGGRAYFGIGAGWYQHETESLGMHFPTMKERFEQLEDILRMARHVWADNREAFKGTHVTAPYPVFNPQPLSDPYPPILIGGSGETKTLRFVAEYGDACNLFGRLPNEELQHKLDVLKRHCDDVGRPYEDIEKTVLQAVDPEQMSMADVLRRFQELDGLGFDHIIFDIQGHYTPDIVAEIGESVVAEFSAA